MSRGSQLPNREWNPAEKSRKRNCKCTYVNLLIACPIGHGLVHWLDVYQKSCSRRALNDNEADFIWPFICSSSKIQLFHHSSVYQSSSSSTVVVLWCIFVLFWRTSWWYVFWTFLISTDSIFEGFLLSQGDKKHTSRIRAEISLMCVAAMEKPFWHCICSVVRLRAGRTFISCTIYFYVHLSEVEMCRRVGKDSLFIALVTELQLLQSAAAILGTSGWAWGL